MKTYFNQATQCVIVDNSMYIVIYSLTRGIFLKEGPDALEKEALLKALEVLEWRWGC